MKVTEITGSDGQTWRIRFTLKALGWFERQTGIRMASMTDDGLANLWLDEMAWLFAAGLYHENKDVTLDDGYELLESLSSEQAQEQLMAALRRDQGLDLPAANDSDDDGQPTQDGTAPKNVTGTGTGSKNRPHASV